MLYDTYLIIYGRGGHQQQMKHLLNSQLFQSSDNVKLVAFTDSLNPLKMGVQETYFFPEFRDKHTNIKTIVSFPLKFLKIVLSILKLLFGRQIKGVVTTGPGIAIIPSIIFRLFGKKLVVFESWSKFNQPSYTAKILYRFAGLFIVQHRSMLKVFPKAKYWGRL